MAHGPEIIKLGEKTVRTGGVEKRKTVWYDYEAFAGRGVELDLFSFFSYRGIDAAQRCS